MCSHTSTYVSSGKSFTGGLGHKASYVNEDEYGVLACVRDWDMEEQLACGVGARQLACFRFDESSKKFHLYDTNDELGVCVCVCVCVCTKFDLYVTNDELGVCVCMSVCLCMWPHCWHALLTAHIYGTNDELGIFICYARVNI